MALDKDSFSGEGKSPTHYYMAGQLDSTAYQVVLCFVLFSFLIREPFSYGDYFGTLEENGPVIT